MGFQPFVGKESVLVNDVLISSTWTDERSWFWRRRGHINLLESSALVSLLEELVRKSPETRVNILLDSQVAKSSQAKGRSSSQALQPLLKRSASLQLVGGLYIGLNFAPTRLNVADDPTRSRPLRLASTRSLLDFAPLEILRSMHATPASRVGALWVRLSVLLIFLPTPEACLVFRCFLIGGHSKAGGASMRTLSKKLYKIKHTRFLITTISFCKNGASIHHSRRERSSMVDI